MAWTTGVNVDDMRAEYPVFTAIRYINSIKANGS
jgi:hypothetical protein